MKPRALFRAAFAELRLMESDPRLPYGIQKTAREAASYLEALIIWQDHENSKKPAAQPPAGGVGAGKVS